jgi:GDP-D-mannose dehydratase
VVRHIWCRRAERYRQGDYTRAKQKLGWEPKVRFAELVKLMVEADLAAVKEGRREFEVVSSHFKAKQP